MKQGKRDEARKKGWCKEKKMQEGDSARRGGRCKNKGTVPGEGDNLRRGRCKKGTM